MWDWLWTITWDQLAEWHQFYELSPWDKERDNLQEAVIGTAIINEIKAVRKEWGSKSVKFLKVDDLLLKFDKKGSKNDTKKSIEQDKRDLGRQFHQMFHDLKRDFVDPKPKPKGKSPKLGKAQVNNR